MINYFAKINKNKIKLLITRKPFSAGKGFSFQGKRFYSDSISLNQDKVSYEQDEEICLSWINFLVFRKFF